MNREGITESDLPRTVNILMDCYRYAYVLNKLLFIFAGESTVHGTSTTSTMGYREATTASATTTATTSSGIIASTETTNQGLAPEFTLPQSLPRP